MNRFNYLAPNRFERAGLIGSALRSKGMRAPIAGVAAALVFVGAARAVEDWRLRSAEMRFASAQARALAVAPAHRRVETLSTEIAKLEKLDEYVRAIRRSGAERAHELASIGNLLPTHVWLTAIRDTESEWAITGGARNVSDVGSAILALEGVPRVISATLVSAQSAEREGSALLYELRLGRQR